MELKELQDKHKGRTAFVVGAGPSLHFQDVEPLKNHITLAVNSGVLKVPFCDYFVSDDEGVAVWNYYMDDLPKLKCQCLLYEDKLKKFASHIPEERIIFFKHKIWYDIHKKKKYPEGVEMTKDAEKPIIGARTSVGTAIHFAYIMGCDPIVLLGSDCCYTDMKRYFWQFNGEKKVVKASNGRVFLPPLQVGKMNNRMLDNHCYDFIEYFHDLAFCEKNKNIHIIDASGGILNCFEKMDFETVLGKYGDR